MIDCKVSLFLDSGAYSAWSKGVNINIDDYIDFIKQNEKYIEIYAGLDVIGDPEKTWENQQYMEERGLKPLITFHKGEDLKWLKKYLDCYDFIALGGIAGGDSVNVVRKHLDRCWGIICDTPDRMPRCKIHGFGMTSLQLMLRYPWYSVDSTSWVLTGRFGSIFVPRYRNGEYIYDENSWKVCVSNRAADDSFQEGKHITTFSPMERDQILQYIHGKGYVLGKSEFRKESTSYKLKDREKWHGKEESDGQRTSKPNRGGYVKRGYAGERIVEIVIEEGISNDYKLRDEMNIIYFLDLEKFLPEWPWAFKRKTPKGFFV